MKRGASLAARVVGLLIAAQFPAFFIAWVILTGMGRIGDGFVDGTLNEMAVVRVTGLVAESVNKDGNGVLHIEPTPSLRAEMHNTAGLRFAAFDPARREPLDGSSPELTETLTGIAKSRPAHMHFAMINDPVETYGGHLSITSTPSGRMLVAIYGQKFRWYDLFYSIASDMNWLVVYISTAILAAAGIAWIAVRRGLTPLKAVADMVAKIDMGSLHQRLPTGAVPAEITPLVDAMNDALKRLDASVMRMRRYTANAAHELRTPLAIMRARLEDAEEPTFKSDLMRDASQLQAIVEQMLIASRLTEHQAALDQEIDLARTVRQIVSDYLPLVIECDRKIEFEAGDVPVVARGNQRAVECVVANLIDNALRAEPTGGTVLVRVDDDAIVEVIDHGEGIALSDREMIFEPFWRKSEATPGTGLGLAIAKELMDKLQGRIWVEETLGGGATFRLSFPAKSPC